MSGLWDTFVPSPDAGPDDERCARMSPTYYRGTSGLAQCTRIEGHYPESNHNISQADFFASIGLTYDPETEKLNNDNEDTLAFISGRLS